MLISPRLKRSSHNLIDQTSGRVFYSADDANATRLCAVVLGAISFGFVGEGGLSRRLMSSCKISRRSFVSFAAAKQLGEAVLNVPGQHNVQ